MKRMSATDATIMAQEEDGEASKKLLSNLAQGGGCLIDAKPPESIKHLIAKEEASTLK